MLAAVVLAPLASAQDVLTFHNDAARSGIQSNETVLNASNVNSSLFGKVFSFPADADVYAQPLYVSAYPMADGKTHNVLLVATAHDTVYAIDADGQNPPSGYLWQTSLLLPGETWVAWTDVATQDINPSIGVVGTPVIDRAGGSVYLVAKSKTTSGTVTFNQRLHALNLADGTEKLNGPTAIQATQPGNGDGGSTVSFNPLLNNQRPALLLAATPNAGSSSSVFIAWASHGDNGRYRGWVISYNAANIAQQTGSWVVTPNGTQGGIWMSAGGLSTDGNGNIFGASGNGNFDANSGGADYGDSLFKLNLTSSGFNVSDWFTPTNQAGLSGSDSDFGVGGAPLILPAQSGPVPHLMVTADKQGEIYLLNRDNLGHFNGNSNSNIQSFDDGGRISIHSNLLFFNNGLFLIPDGGPAETWAFNPSTGLFNTTPQSKSTHTFGCLGCDGSGSNFTISANGSSNGIVWAIDYSQYGNGPAVLYAFDATNLSNQLYSSTQAANGRDQALVAVKFSAPTVANGKVYVGGRNGVTAYGLLGAGSLPAAAPVFSPAAGTFTAPQTVTISDTTPSASIYYTTDGSVPNSNSILDTGPLTFTSTTTLKAIATAIGYSSSAVTTGTYTISASPPAATPTFSPMPGTYASAQTVSILDATSNAVIYYTTNGSTPTTSSTIYSSPLTVTATTTLKALATAPGHTSSSVGSATYTISSAVTANPSFSPAGGSFTSAQTVTISDATANAVIHYTTNGATPTTNSTIYHGPITISSNTTLSAIAAAPAHNNSAVVVVNFIISSNVLTATPVISPGPGNYSSPQTVTITDSTAGAAIYYSTNDTIPTTSSIPYNGPFLISRTTTLRAIAVAPTYKSSLVASETLVITSMPVTAAPTFSPAGGTFPSAQRVTIADATSNAIIYYTTNGSTPTTNSPVYSGAITVSATTTINAIAKAPNYLTSPVVSATFTISSLPQATAPAFSPAGGIYTSSQSVTLTDSTPSAAIYYTTDGSTPTTSSTYYSSPIPIAVSTTISAIAAAPGYSNSPIAKAAYVISAGGGIDFSQGFTTGSITLNGSAKVTGSRLRLTDGGAGEAGSAFYSAPVNVSAFNSTFNFLLTNASADGFTFTIQGTGVSALGPKGGGLGYGPDNPGGTPGIGKSVAIKFDLYNNAGESSDSTGIYTNGASPTVPFIDLSNTGINLHSGDQFQAQMNYDGTTLTVTITDTVTNASATQHYSINIPGYVGGTTAFVGFTGGDGGITAIQDVLNWVYSN